MKEVIKTETPVNFEVMILFFSYDEKIVPIVKSHE